MALHGYDRPTSVKEIAERTGLPQPYLEQILLAVKGAGLARSKRGVGGGYVLARAPDEITLADIVAAADGPITTYFDSHDHREGHCALQDVWVKVSESMRSILEGFTLADLVERAKIGHLDAEGRPLGINPSRRREYRRQFGRQRIGELEALLRHRVIEGQGVGVEERPPGLQGIPVATVGAVADDRVADGGQVHPDLVGAARLEPALDEGADRVVVLGEDLVAGAGLLARLPHRHAGPPGGGPADGGVDASLAGRRTGPRPAPGSAARWPGRPVPR